MRTNSLEHVTCQSVSNLCAASTNLVHSDLTTSSQFSSVSSQRPSCPKPVWLVLLLVVARGPEVAIPEVGAVLASLVPPSIIARRQEATPQEAEVGVATTSLRILTESTANCQNSRLSRICVYPFSLAGTKTRALATTYLSPPIVFWH